MENTSLEKYISYYISCYETCSRGLHAIDSRNLTNKEEIELNLIFKSKHEHVFLSQCTKQEVEKYCVSAIGVAVDDEVSKNIIDSKYCVLTYLKTQRCFPPRAHKQLQFSRISRHRTFKNTKSWSLKHCIFLGFNGINELKYHRM